MMKMERGLVLTKIISGGQIGADQAGLFAAHAANLPTGGTAPLNYRTWTGDNPSLLKDRFGLVQDASYGYKPRTQKNVMMSDGTLIIAKNLHSPGCLLTSRTAIQKKKPVLGIKVPSDRDLSPEELVSIQDQVREFLITNQINTLNIAGNRDHLAKSFSLFDTCLNILTPIFKESYERNAH